MLKKLKASRIVSLSLLRDLRASEHLEPGGKGGVDTIGELGLRDAPFSVDHHGVDLVGSAEEDLLSGGEVEDGNACAARGIDGCRNGQCRRA